jgi:hypothetical protein
VVTRLLLLVAGGLALGIVQSSQHASKAPAVHAEVITSIEGGVAWIWPDSNGPHGNQTPRSRATSKKERIRETLQRRGTRMS